MRFRNLVPLLFLGFVSTLSFSQHNLSLDIAGVKSDDGNVCFALYTDETSFLKFDKVFK